MTAVIELVLLQFAIQPVVVVVVVVVVVFLALQPIVVVFSTAR